MQYTRKCEAELCHPFYAQTLHPSQETAAAVGVTAASKAFFGLSGPVRAMILLNLGSALFGSNQVPPSSVL